MTGFFRVVYPILLGATILTFPMPDLALADSHGKVRMYKLNKKGQLLKQRWLKDEEVAGCHDTFKARNVHRFAQVGYAYCQLFSTEGCQAGSEVTAKWGGERYKSADFDLDEPQVNLPKGTEWFLHESENVQIKSWACYYPE